VSSMFLPSLLCVLNYWPSRATRNQAATNDIKVMRQRPFQCPPSR
jgi:hypothetical protein